MGNRNEYFRVYMARRRKEMRAMAIDLLGGCCERCGSEDDLQIDHIDPKEKSFTVSTRDVGKEKLLEELEKCQLLCQRCHSDKTIVGLGKKPAPGTHGTLSSYRYCHCEECRRAKREWSQAYRAKKKQQAT